MIIAYRQMSNFAAIYFGDDDDDDDNEVRLVLAQHSELDFYSSSSLKQHVPLGHELISTALEASTPTITPNYLITYRILTNKP